MKITMPVGPFMNLAKQVLQFSGRGREVDPGLSLVHVKVTAKGHLRLSAHDASAGARVQSPVPGEDFEPGAMAVDREQLDRLTSILPNNGHVTLGPTFGPKIKVTMGDKRLRLSLPFQDQDNFPKMPKPPADGWFEVAGDRLMDIVNRCLWSMCKDDSRPALSGVHMCSECSESADGMMMSNLQPGIVPAGQDVVVPGDSWNKLRALVDNGQRLRMCIESNRVWLRHQDWAVYSLLIASSFPPLSNLIFDVDGDGNHFVDDENRVRVYWITVNRHEALSVVRRIVGASVSQEEKKLGAAVSFVLYGDELHFVSHYPFDDLSNSIIVDERVDWGEGSVKADDLEGFTWLRNIGIYGQFMRWALSSLSSDVIKIMWAEGDGIGSMPMQFHDEGAGAVAAVMPRRI